MQYYQTFSPNSYYQAPAYGMQQPGQGYADRMAQYQQPMPQSFQPQQAPTAYQPLVGRIVDDFNVITANDVPMDGNGAIFIKRDGNEIQLRNWTAQGTIATSRFKPALDEQTENLTPGSAKWPDERLSAFEAAFMQRFDSFEQKLEKLEKSFGKKSKKEGADDE